MYVLNMKDFYKTDHISQYPKNTEQVYSNFTARSDKRFTGSSLWDSRVVWFGLQRVILDFLLVQFGRQFFDAPKNKAVKFYKRRMDTALGEGAVSMNHIEALWELGFLPIEIKALPEGSRVNMKIPLFTIKNTHKDFGWLTNDLETVLSCELWKPLTVATIAYEYSRLLKHYAEVTGSPMEFVQFQGHDFSMRGMSNRWDATFSGLGHLLSFTGTDTIPAIDAAEMYYEADADKELIGTSVPATEHSVMCMGGKETEIETFRRLITEVYPAGIVSIVSDTWDFWKVVTEYMQELKQTILDRPVNALGLSKVVLRPDSGDPLKIICGDPDADKDTPAYKGALQCLWEVFGGTVNSAGYKVLDSHIGLIYGDSITIQRAEDILARMAELGFASCNVVFGIGSFTYQYITRDTFGIAIKATYGVVDGFGYALQKDPATDDGTKKSARGLLRVEMIGDEYVLYDNQTEEQETQGCLETVFKDGELLKKTTLKEVRQRLGALLQ